MRVLHVVPSYLPGFRYGGPIASVHGLCRGLARRGARCEVWTTDRDEGVRLDVHDHEEREIDGVRVRYFRVLGPERLRYAPSMARALEQEVEAFDLVHAHGLFQYPTTLALAAARRRGVPQVLSPRGMLQREVLAARGRLRKRLWLAWLDHLNLRRLPLLHVTSDLERERLPELGFAWPDSVVVPNPVEHVGFDGDWTAVPEPVSRVCAREPELVLFLGRLHAKKGLDLLCEAFARVPQGPHLAIAGPDEGYGPRLGADLDRLGLRDRVTVLGPVQGQAKAALLEHARCLVLPSRSENFANVVFEAMAAGTPPIVTPDVGAAQWVRDGCGAVVHADVTAWTATIGSVLGDAAGTERMARRGRSVARSVAAPGVVAERMLEAYAGLAGTSQRVEAA